MKASRFLSLAALALAALALSGCPSGGTVPVAFSLTDAPVDTSIIKSVLVSFGGIEINQAADAAVGDGSWIAVPIDPSAQYDLLDLSGGVSTLMGTLELPAGTQINQIRFVSPVVTVVETDDVPYAATFLSTTGLKVVNSFSVPLNGELGLTFDFDLRKSIVKDATGYKVTPAIRAVVTGEAGRIAGTLPAGYVVYAYEAGTYVDSEATPAEGTPSFAGAVTSATADAAGGYVLAFLAPMSYDLVVVVEADGSVASLDYAGIAVESDATTEQDIAVAP